MAGDRGEKVAGRRLADSLRASSGVAELLTRLAPLAFFTMISKCSDISSLRYGAPWPFGLGIYAFWMVYEFSNAPRDSLRC